MLIFVHCVNYVFVHSLYLNEIYAQVCVLPYRLVYYLFVAQMRKVREKG